MRAEDDDGSGVMHVDPNAPGAVDRSRSRPFRLQIETGLRPNQ